MKAGHSFNAGDRAPFKQKLQSSYGLVKRDSHIVQRVVLFFAECLSTLLAAITLDFLWAKFSKLPTDRRTVMTNHIFEPCLSLAIGSKSVCLKADASNRV